MISSRTCLLLGLTLYSCSRPEEARVHAIQEGMDLEEYRLVELTGVRDGDNLEARAVFTAPPESLTLEMSFQIGVPTSFSSGYYRWYRDNRVMEGSITADSVTFLGGQGDRPFLGGAFQLLSSQGVPVYQITLPTTRVDRSKRSPAQVLPIPILNSPREDQPGGAQLPENDPG